MKRTFSLALAVFVFTTQMIAQSLEEGKKFMYYERFASARDVFQKLVTAKPADAEANYWLGQAYIGLEDVPKAKQVYQTALQNNGNAPLLLVGMGEIELLEHKTTSNKGAFPLFCKAV